MVKQTPELNAARSRAKRLQSTLKGRLLQEEMAFFSGVRHEFSHQIRWKALIKLTMTVLESLMRSCLSRRGVDFPPLAWLKQDPRPSLLNAEREFLDHPHRSALRQKYVGLLLLRKLLGGVKQEVDRRIREIEPVSIMAEVEQFQELSDLSGQEAEQIHELVLNGEVQTPFPIDETLEPVKGGYMVRGGVAVQASGSCKHIHKVMTQKRDKRLKTKITSCRDCGLKLSAVVEPGKLAPCPCQDAVWVKGKEGKEAICDKCQAPIQDPGRFLWVLAGLEPVGDDPTKDQIISLKEVMGDAAASH